MQEVEKEELISFKPELETLKHLEYLPVGVQAVYRRELKSYSERFEDICRYELEKGKAILEWELKCFDWFFEEIIRKCCKWYIDVIWWDFNFINNIKLYNDKLK